MHSHNIYIYIYINPKYMPIQDVLLLCNVSHGGVISANGTGTSRANGGGSGYSQYIPTIRVGLPAGTFESASLGSVPRVLLHR